MQTKPSPDETAIAESSGARSSTRQRPIIIANPGADLYGSDRMVLETVSALVAKGERVVVALPRTGPLVAELGRRGAAVAIIPTPILRKAALRPTGALQLARKTLAALLPGLAFLRRLDPKLVLVNTITPPLWFLLARVAGIPVVGHVHEGESSAPAVLQKVVALPLLLSRRLIINSQFSLDTMAAALPALRNRSSVVYNAVPGPTAVSYPRPDLAGPVRLVYVGRLSPRKGPDVAVQAIDLLVRRGCDVTLDLVGAVFPGYEWFERKLYDQIEGSGLGDRVALRGFQSDVWPYVEGADVCLIPSTLDEPFGNTAVEAALACRPSIVSRTSGLIEASSGLRSAVQVSPGSAEEIAHAAELIIANWPAYAEAAVQDSIVAHDRYSWDNYQKSINEILAEVVA